LEHFVKTVEAIKMSASGNMIFFSYKSDFNITSGWTRTDKSCVI